MELLKCIRTYSECSKVSRDIFGNLITTDFVQAFKKDCYYKIFSEENGIFKILNEQNQLSEFGKEFTNYFEFITI